MSAIAVTVIGTGYVGLVTGACLAEAGHTVHCIDNNPEKLTLLQAGRSPIYEPGLDDLLHRNMAAGRLRFSDDLATGVRDGEILFIAVGTPPLPSGEADTRFVAEVARGIGQHLDARPRVVVNKSTVPIGSGDWVRMLILDGCREAGGTDVPEVTVISNPEFLREGSAIWDTFNPDRIVLGGGDERAMGRMKDLYAPIVEGRLGAPRMEPVPVVVTDLASAEMIKYAANAFLATKISFINEIANICDRVGADVTQVARGIGLDSRIGPRFLSAGIGWGGSCFPKDVSALAHIGQDYGYAAELLQAAIAVNRRQRLIALEKLQQVLKILKGKTIGLLGLTFKPDTDDLRDAPALTLAQELQRLGAKVKAYDPWVSSQPQRLHSIPETLEICGSPEDLARDCDALVLATEWAEFRELDLASLAAVMRQRWFLDGRNFLSPAQLEAAGLTVLGIGRTGMA